MELSTWGLWAVVSAGSASGGLLRHLVTEGINRFAGGGLFPLGTLVVNVAGSFLAGAAVGLLARSPGPWDDVIRYGAVTGFLGGFTTFSAFSVQTVLLAQQGAWSAAALHVGASVALSVLACAAGFAGAAGVHK
jgi:fluoride exporter